MFQCRDTKAVLAFVVVASFLTGRTRPISVTGSMQSVQIDSTPGNAVGKINNRERGQSHVRAELSRAAKK